MKAQPWAVALGCFVAGSLAAAGIASATSAPTKIPDSTTGVITACMVKKTGAVRFINAQAGKTCKKKEKKITFNKTGPQGERGPSNGYVANRTTTVGIDALLVPAGQPKNRVVEVTLPAGSYLVNASTSVHRLGTTTTQITCTLMSTSGTLSSVPVVTNVNQQYYDVPLAATGSYTNTAEATVYLRCDPSGGAPLTAEGEANGATLTATRVAELTGP
jgi:hypothetical protein